MTPPNDSGHDATPEHGLHGGAEDVDETSEGTYLNSQGDDEDQTTHRHPDDEGSYVDVEPEDADEPIHPDPGRGHYPDVDRDDSERHDDREDHDDQAHDDEGDG